jgi:hypothetical protein
MNAHRFKIRLELRRQVIRRGGPMSDEKPKRNLITMKATLAKGGFKRTKAYELINAGIIVAYKMGHTTMVDADSIDRYHDSLPRIEPHE